MCLNTCAVALEWNRKEQAFVGYGYKRIDPYLLKKYNRWSKAKGMRVIDGTTYGSNSVYSQETSNDDVGYFPGFHIFNNMDDARNYEWDNEDHVLVKVMYKNVVAYGTNDLNPIDDSNGECVVAQYMKVVEVLELQKDEDEEEGY